MDTGKTDLPICPTERITRTCKNWIIGTFPATQFVVVKTETNQSVQHYELYDISEIIHGMSTTEYDTITQKGSSIFKR